MRIRRLFAAAISAVLLFFIFSSYIPVNAVSLPKLQIMAQPQKEYRLGDILSLTVISPNYKGKVEYRVILNNNDNKRAYQFWNMPKTGYYNTAWTPYGNKQFIIKWPIKNIEPGNYSIAVLTRRAGKKVAYDSYVRTIQFLIKNIEQSNPQSSIQNNVQSVTFPDLSASIKQNQTFNLPGTVTGISSDGTQKQYNIKWDTDSVNTAVPGSYKFIGTPEGTDKQVKFILNIEEDKFKKDSYGIINPHTYEIVNSLFVTAPVSMDYNLTYNLGTFSDSLYQVERDLKVIYTKTSVKGENETKEITFASNNNPQMTLFKSDRGNIQLKVNDTVNPGEKIEYRIIRRVMCSGIKYTMDLSDSTSDYSGFKDFKRYTSPGEKIESDNLQIINKAKEIFGNQTNPYLKAKAAYEFVNRHMTYDTSNGNKSALSALTTGRGVCEDYAELFTALMRASGVPARVVTGYRIDPDNFKADTADGSLYRHAWAEFYLPEYGWVIADPTYINTVRGRQIITFDFFTKIDNPGYFIEGYDIDGEYTDSMVTGTYRYNNSSNAGGQEKLILERKSTINRIN